MIANYFFIDGSTLTAQIRRLRRSDATFQNRKLDPQRFIAHFRDALDELGAHEYKRAIFYFPKGDEVAVSDYLLMPDIKKPGLIRDLHFKFCGEKLKRSAEFNRFVEDTVPPKWQDRVNKSEKGIDIEICCDALKLASASRLERLFLFTNDDDFTPLCRALKEFGANISLIHLCDAITPNKSLLSETDSYDVIPTDALQKMFLPPWDPNQEMPPSPSSGTTDPAKEDTDVPVETEEDVEEESGPSSDDSPKKAVGEE